MLYIHTSSRVLWNFLYTQLKQILQMLKEVMVSVFAVVLVVCYLLSLWFSCAFSDSSAVFTYEKKSRLVVLLYGSSVG